MIRGDSFTTMRFMSRTSLRMRFNMVAALLICGGLSTAGAAIPVDRPPATAVSVSTLVGAAIAGDQARMGQIAAELKTQPRPARGDRRVARDLNERGLALWQRQRFGEAAVLFGQARHADASDAEIAENLGYALLKSGQVSQAEAAILA